MTNSLFLPRGASLVWLETPVRAALDDYEPLVFHHVYAHKVPLGWENARCAEPGTFHFVEYDIPTEFLSSAFLNLFADPWFYATERCDYVAPIPAVLDAFDRAVNEA